MKDVDFPVWGIDNLGNSQMMYPENEYTFKGNEVLEIPIKQKLNNYLEEINKTYNKLNLEGRNSLYLTLLKDGVSSSGFLISSELSDNKYSIFR